jgi:hypothetical protein
LESFGIHILRFSESETKTDMFNVIRTIESKVIAIVKQDKSIRLPKEFDKDLFE